MEEHLAELKKLTIHLYSYETLSSTEIVSLLKNKKLEKEIMNKTEEVAEQIKKMESIIIKTQ
jgi:hypothetical protein